jgi:dihydroorotase
VSGDPRFFLGTDSAPHVDAAKEAACGCAGCYTAPVALPLLAHVFDEESALERLEGFASLNGPRWYGLPANDDTVTLARGHRPGEAKVGSGEGDITVFDPGFPIAWHLTKT